MNNKLWLSLSILIVIGVICAVIIHAVRSTPGVTVDKDGNQVVCTMEAKLCPDGSSVGRTGPKCEFAACPGASSNTSPSSSKTSSSAQTKTGVITETDATNFAPYKSGVNGVVTLNSKAYATMVAVFRSSDRTHAYAFTQTDQNGLYAFSLPPGSYVLGAGEGNSPQCSQPEITVGTNSYVTANIACK